MRVILFTWLPMLAAAVLLAVLPAASQYPGQVSKNNKDSPEMRAISVLEWTGEAGKPKASRIVPVTVLDAGVLQDGGIYMARPEPLALAAEVEYELEQNGKKVGLYDIRHAGQEQGSWVGFGFWKPLPVPKPKPAAAELAQSKPGDEESDRPTLHRKKHGDSQPAGGTGSASGGGGGSGSAAPAPTADPDRPTLHKKDQTANESDSSSAPADDPDRPVLKKGKKKQAEDLGHVDSVPGVTDPDRPTLKRGKSSGNNLEVVPSLMGMPTDMEQTVAVSDTRSRPEHLWSFVWANADDEAKMKSDLEGVAREALGLNPPPPPARPAPRKTTTRKSVKPLPALPPPAPVPLPNEQFRVFELAYGSGATLVLTAHTDGDGAEQKFVTLVAQPDLYGNPLVLLKNVTDGAHLDVKPRMRLVDAVDALADNRGELLFELRGSTQRQFALYRVLRGNAERLFVSGAGEFEAETRQ